MPVIGRFYGITVKMFYRQTEHNPPHVHAIYGEYYGVFRIEDGKMYLGDMPLKGQQLVEEFIKHHRDRLLQMWEKQEYVMLPSVE